MKPGLQERLEVGWVALRDVLRRETSDATDPLRFIIMHTPSPVIGQV